ncbi:predicted protein [Postia placenta Mad-698-R]|nr:predicted protein [Postia placenta Mad-698-R]
MTLSCGKVVDPSPVHISHDQYPDQLVPKESTEQHTSSNENRTHAIATTDADSEAEAGSGTGAYKTEDVVSNAQDERSANTLSPEQHVFEDAFQNQAATGNRLPTHEPNMPDLVTSIRGMYRILDLINEQGSGGLVDKVIISQESLGKFMNDLQPGSYISITKVDFAVLDNIGVKPIGIYGSKTEIIRFLESVDAVGNATAHALRAETSQSLSAVRPVLRSGLYILRVPQGGVEDGAEVLYAIYWPEDTTWEYNPPSTAERNRVTFMRYLTKIADQLVALISDDDAGKIIWKGDDDDVAPHDLDEDEDEDDRMFIFKVTKLHEQEENVTSRPGWTIEVPSFPSSPPPNISDNFASLPCLIHGEERQGLLHAVFVPARRISKALDEVFTESRLRSLIKDKSFRLDHDISVASIEILLSLGLVERAPAASKAYRSRVDEIQCRAKESGTAQEKQIQTKLKENADRLQRALRDMCIQHIIRKYPAVDPLSLAEPSTQDSSDSTDVGTQHGHGTILSAEQVVLPLTIVCVDALDDLSKLHPGIRDVLADAEKDHQWQSVRTPQMKKYKERILLLDFMFQDLGNAHATRDEMAELINAVINQGDTKTMAEVVKSSDGSNQSFFAKTLSFFFGTDVAKDRITQAENYAADVSYAVFLSSLDSIVEREPLLFDAALETKRLAHETLKRNVNTQMHKLMARIQKLQEDALKPQIWHDVNSQRDHDIELARTEFVQAVYDSFVSTTGRTFYLINTVTKASRYISFHSWAVSGSSEEYSESALRYTIRPILLTEEDGNRLKLDPSFIPTPRVPSYAAASFELPLEKHISHIQALPNNRCLLIVDDRRSTVKVYLEPLLSLAHALEHHNAEKKLLSREKIGEQCIFAFNEAKRMLAVLGISQAEHRVELHIFVFDENYTTLKGLGSAVKLNPWYDNAVTITHATFVCGSEELALVDDRARVRIFSIVTQQFRPAFQQLDSVPDAIYSSPDGACLLSLHTVAGTSVMRVYHWSTFGSSGGISVGLNELNTNDCVVTSLCRRTNVHVVSLDADSGRCASLALDITRKATEFAFRGEKEGVAQSTQTEAARNCFLDCHVDVWRRFPVISAIRRQTISSSSRRKSRTLVCVTSLDQAAYAPYFANCISSFEKATQKPTGTELSGIEATALRYEAFASRTDLGGDVSCFRAGEWLADILCLIPIQIAVARENRFIPIKDGVFSNDLERSLLGADVARIIDSLSIGEQSVGKSFALNHLVDTSFAGSAMRTTEGVWMSVAPLDDMIIVALDFEEALGQTTLRVGVHSIERSAQEDTLLVLFNTAISNLSNDWGALSQTMTAHRAQLLLTLLPNALAFGATEVTPEFEPLKDLDTNILITEPDTTSRFFVTELIDREGMIQRDDALATVIRSWHNFAKRPEIPEQEWIEDLTSFLDRTVEKRIGAVQEWISMNTKRCPADHADMQSLQRAARSMIIDLKSNCAECQLSCILRRHHEGGHSCQTSHKCLLNCEYEERDVEPCGLPAGHPGTHICHITAHLCGKPCELRVTNLTTDIYVIRDNARSSVNYANGCVPMGTIYTPCKGRRCICVAPGLCYIETTPQSVEATFTGRHETFQYTKCLNASNV